MKSRFRVRLGELFVLGRERKGWRSPNRVKDETGLSAKPVSEIDTGTGDPQWSSLERYAAGIGYTVEDMLVAAAHPESEDAFGHPDVQKFIRVWKTLDVADRASLMRRVDTYEELLKPAEAAPDIRRGRRGG